MKLRNLVLTGMMTALLLPMGVFADDTEQTEREWQDIRLEQVAEYTPEQFEEWSRLFESKETLQVEREALKAELELLIETVWKPMIESEKAENKALIQAYADALRDQVVGEEISKEEATVLLQAYKDELRLAYDDMKSEREAEKIIREENKIYFDGLRDSRASMNEAIKLALDNGEFEIVSDYLNEILVINQELELHAMDVNEQIIEAIEEINDL